MIKFRIWDKKNGMYFTGPVNIDGLSDSINYSLKSSDIREVEPFIGKKDFFGRDIYVGDVMAQIDYCSVEDNSLSIKRLEEFGMLVKHVPPCPKGFRYEVWFYRNGVYSIPREDSSSVLWLTGECFGYEGECLQDTKDWMVYSNIHSSHMWSDAIPFWNKGVAWENREETGIFGEEFPRTGVRIRTNGNPDIWSMGAVIP